MTVLRRVLGYEVSVEALIELAMWLSIPYLIVGVAWTFFHPEHMQLFETALQTRLPAGADLAGFGISILLWPMLMFAPGLCPV